MSAKSVTPSGAISLPKGGGAIKSIGETFQPNLFSGTGNFSVPIATSPGRGGLGPTLTLQYSSGNGNGPFGLGWQLQLPRVTRKTEKGLPTYTDDDVFVISGAEDLVRYLDRQAEGDWRPVTWQLAEYTITLYRSRTEGQFARIERWMRADGDTHWRTTTPDNVVSIFGRTPSSRVADPEDEQRVFEWLLEETFDARGNHIVYEYIQENPSAPVPGLSERNRSRTQTYLRRILYGNTPDTLADARKAGPGRTTTDHVNPLGLRDRHYALEVLFEYADPPWPPAIPSDPSADSPTVPDGWPVREDPFSSFRAGFEIRTLRRCRRVVMLHHFHEGEVDGAPLVRSTDLAYTIDPDTRTSLLASVTSCGYRRDPEAPDRYLERRLPPVTFGYATFQPHTQRYESVTAVGGDLPAVALDAPELSLVDHFGDGIPDIVRSDATGYRCWRNLGEARLDRPRQPPGATPPVALDSAGVALADLGGDGLADLVVQALPAWGFYESRPDGGWRPFRRFDIAPGFELSDPNVRLVDLDGDGLSDVLITRDDHFVWYRSRGERGFDEPRLIARRHDADLFPDVYFDDPSGRVRLADMSGDGLTDIVLVHDGRIDYWPNLGYGRFGRRLTMENAPRLGEAFDPRRLFLVDLDGTGCTDLVYVGVHEVHFWFNQSGNAWSNRQTLHGTPPAWDPAAIQFADFYGTGTATLVWSYDAGIHPGSNFKVLDFCGGTKPHLLVEMNNNMGATTRVKYAPSTKFYLEDMARGAPWATALPFPVQVIEKSEVIDHVGRTKLMTVYKYHHGYYDGREREFRGFGRVDQFDTESFADFTGPGLHGDPASFDNGERSAHVPPVETRSWFHTGVYFDADREVDAHELTERYRAEYYHGDPGAYGTASHAFQDAEGRNGVGGSPHEAFRALRGALLRTEVFGRDGSERADDPYLVTESRYWVKELQPRRGFSPPVYLTIPLESVTQHYERRPDDPRTASNLTLGADEFGNVTDTVNIAYPRRAPSEVPEQGTTQTVYTHTDFINRHRPASEDAGGFYYARIPCQTRSYEVTGIGWSPGDPPLSGEKFTPFLDASLDVDPTSFEPYEWSSSGASGVHRRLIEWTRNYFRSDADPRQIDPVGTLAHRLPLGEIDSLGLPYEGYQAAFTDQVLHGVYGDRADDVDLAREGGYHPHPDHPLAEGSGPLAEYWWIPSGRAGFDPTQFYATERFQDPFGGVITTRLDEYALLTEAVLDALPEPRTNIVTARNDYRVLQPFEMTDPNGNRTQAAFDALGMVVGTAVMGSADARAAIGDSLEGFAPDLADTVRDRHIDDPLGLDPASGVDPHALLGHASTRILYDADRFGRTGAPNLVYLLSRETHVSDEGGMPTRLQHAFVYSDGFGREIQKKAQAEPAPDGGVRWVGSGWTIYNNKGKPVRQYEPFFSGTHQFEFDARVGVSPVLFYDPLERVVATLHPNGTWEKTVFDAWRLEAWDVVDTVLIADPKTDPDVGGFFHRLPDAAYLPTWHARRQGGALGPHEQAAAQQAGVHAGTPAVRHTDALGRTVLTVIHNRVKYSNVSDGEPPQDAFFSTRSVYDIEGNQLGVIDAAGRLIVRYGYDMLGTGIHQASMDAGDRWVLNDVAGKPIRRWDSREQAFRSTYDELRRPMLTFLRAGDGAEVLIGRTVYGEEVVDATSRNLRGQVAESFDQAGLVSNDAFDFKGNLLASRRQLARNYATVLDWSGEVPLEEDVHHTRTAYDALDRPLELTSPDGSVVRPLYNEGSLLDRVDVTFADGGAATTFVSDLAYNAKGQRTRLEYGNGVVTEYAYDPQTFRICRIHTVRAGDTLQDLSYSYDPAGNLTHVADAAHQTIFFDNHRVDPSCRYVYDAVHRLVEAAGREHLGLAGGTRKAPAPPDAWNTASTGLHHPGDGTAMGSYLERYRYDAVGNILSMEHRGTDPQHAGWIRSYTYTEPSQLEPDRIGNRLSSTAVGEDVETYRYDGAAGRHGSITAMPHLPLMLWDSQDQLRATSRQAVNDGLPETTYYVYDAAGQRVRKVTDRHAPSGSVPTRREERIYLGGFEIFREYAADGQSVVLERETLHVVDGAAQRIALIERRTQGDDGSPEQLVRYQLGNHLGSAVLELDDQGHVISYEEYFPYGGTSYQAGRRTTDPPKRYRFSGKERDEESGLYYHEARYYACWLGRWCSADPVGIKAGLNLYQYCLSNPVRFVDRSGLDVIDSLKVFAGNVVGTAHALVGYETDRELDENQAAGYAWAQDKFGWQKSEHVQRVREDIVNDPYLSKIVGGALGLASGFVPGEWEGEDLPESMQHYYNMTRYASTRANMILGGVQVLRSTVRIPPAPPALATSTGFTAQTASTVLTASAPSPAALAMAAVSNSATKGNLANTGGHPQGKGPAPKPHNTLVGRSVSHMRRAAAKVIAQTKGHQLKFLLNKAGKFRPTRGLKHSQLINKPGTVQMGHITSKVSGSTERIMLQDAWLNQLNNVAVEGKGVHAFVENVAIDIGGIAVDLNSAQLWENLGWLSKGTVAKAPRLHF